VLARARHLLDGGRADRIVVLGLVLLAAILRFVNLPTRGTWDADQGHDMLVLRGLVQLGALPLLGPPTSIGDFHHGVLYYYLLAPAAALTGADPIGVVAAIATAGVAAVAVTWWLARSIGGPVAGLVAGLLMAVSASAIDESTFIWNPNLIALSASIALAAAWRAWTTRQSGWWIVAAAGVVVTMHCHVLGSALLPPVAGLLVADARRRRSSPGEGGRDGGRSSVIQAGLIGLGLLVVSYVPLLVHELGSDWSEARAAAGFIAGGGELSGVALPIRMLIVGWRVLAWPIAGLVTDVPRVAMLAAFVVIGFGAWLVIAARDPERTAVRWLVATLAWTIIALTFAASGLATVIAGLPNDHYHAFADPIVFVVVGLGVAALAALRPVGSAVAVALVVLIVAYNVTRQPPAVAPDGGWPAAQAAATRILRVTPPGARIALVSLPVFKASTAIEFPLVAAGASVTAADPGAPVAGPLVVLCDELFEEAIGAACGGPAETKVVPNEGLELVERFEAAPGRWVSVYTAH
jgi:Dolichyl-phosphate-mannose-protein mannosyltransferase